MDQRPGRPAPRARRSRAELKQETRNALIEAGLVAFSRDGYHGATLEGIAAEAGFSKGAVYSNFGGGKAELFLAVMDYNLEALRGADWDPVASSGDLEDGSGDDVRAVLPGGAAEAVQMVRGFELAALEFITTAARDEGLIQALRLRVQVLLDAYERVASAYRPDDDGLRPDELAQLMVALDQGASVLALSGVAAIDGALMRDGLRRLLLAPRGLDGDHRAQSNGHHTSLPSTVVQVRRLIRDAFGDGTR